MEYSLCGYFYMVKASVNFDLKYVYTKNWKEKERKKTFIWSIERKSWKRQKEEEKWNQK